MASKWQNLTSTQTEPSSSVAQCHKAAAQALLPKSMTNTELQSTRNVLHFVGRGEVV